jgi:hypothetical protein
MSYMRKLERRPDKKKKRGVILLIVVTLLTLLVLIGVTFVLFANRSLQDSSVGLRREEYREPPEKMFEQAVGQLLFDTVCRSALRGHSLLEDLYGPDFITGQVASITAAGPDQNNDNGDQWPHDPGPPAAQQPLQLPHGQAFGFQFNVMLPTQPNQLMPWIDYYTGRVITFTSGNAAGHSTRILQYDPSITPPRLHIEAIETKRFGILVPNVNDTFIINGAPFNGTGAGFDPYNTGTESVLNVSAVYARADTATSLTPFPSTDLVALLPHFNGYDPYFGMVFFNTTSTTGGLTAKPINQGLALGGFDEPWDAPDYQNMFLAMVPPTYAQWKTDGDPTTPDLPLLPSFHRPELVNYWVNYMIQSIFTPAGVSNATDQFEVMAQPYGADHVRDNADDDVPVPRSTLPIAQRDRIQNITRCSIFRPMPWDHPNFTGSNSMLPQGPSTPAATAPRFPGLQAQALFNALRGFDLGGTIANVNLYDVDNDNDGLADSIWIDLGFPVVTRPDGKRYKPLFAFLVEDLDGRIDMNAHGNLAQVAKQEIPAASGQFHLPFRPQYRVPGPNGFGLAPGQPTNTYLPRGIGFGPAEVDFLNLFFNPATTAFQVDPALPATVNGPVASYENILRGRYTSGIANDVWPGPLPGALPGVPGAFEPLNEIKHHGVPNDFATWGAWYASPPDVWGRGAVVLDWGGQPLYAPFAAANGEMIDNPYELKLSGELSDADSPYTLSELEKMLRYHDNDAQRLVSRPLLPEAQGGALLVLAANPPGIIGPDQTARNRMSGRSSYIPAPSGIPPGTQMVPPTAGVTNPSWRGVLAQFSNNIIHPGSASILDMYAFKINAALQASTGGPTTPAMVNAVMHQLIPWELRHGEKFDLNRWLGNGFDSQGGPPYQDGVADDPIEAFADPANGGPPPFNGPREFGWLQPAQFANGTTSPAEHSNGLDVNNDGVPTFLPGSPAQRSLDRMLARQLYARQLYCLATLFIDPTFDPPMPHEPALTQAQRRELFLRRIAQWAINVVDARDSDAIMTPFEYDQNPWDGWDVDSDLTTDGVPAAQGGLGEERLFRNGAIQQVPNAQRRVVWGVEHPELLIKETFAFHSRNIRDTPNDTTTKERSDGDDDPDQLRIPQGSLYFELYNARARVFAGQAGNQKPRLPAELYDLSVPGNPRLMLGKVAPGGWPVWRIGISELSNAGSNANLPDTSKPMQMATTNPESASFEPSMPAAMGLEPPRDINLMPTSVSGNPPNFVTLNRFVWFTTPAQATGPAGSALANNSFYSNSNAMPLIEPGQYAVVGPRLTTYIGSRDPAQVNPVPVGLWGGWSPQRLEMNAGGLTVYDTTLPNGNSTTPAVGSAIRNAVSIVADIDRNLVTPNGWANPCRWNIGLNITEPLPSGNYYPEPPDLSPYPMNYPVDAYDDLDAPTGTFLDEPSDYSRVLDQHDMIETKTYADVASIYLQRLANPNLAWDPLGNPYLTVDWAAVDVNVFAGDENTNRQVTVMGNMEDLEPRDAFVGAAGRPMNWETRQRGSSTAPLVAPRDANLWRPVTFLDTATPTGNLNAAPTELYFNLGLVDAAGNPLHTLSWLNSKLGQPMGTPMFAPAYVGEIIANPNPFPWLVHLDRPFANPFEILTVPASTSARLGFEFTPGDLTGALGPNPYNVADPTSLRAPFAHLLNFFHTEDTGPKQAVSSGPPVPVPPPAMSPQFNRLLDYVEVPSPYVGAERWFNPSTGYFDNAGLYRPPFNKMSRFRDAGRININTIFDDQILISAIGHFPGKDAPGTVSGSFVDKVFRSRQGYGALGATYFVFDPNFPTMFANPFRPLDSADLMPNVPPSALSMRKDGQSGRSMPVDATFFRPDPDIGPDRVPLFDLQATAAPNETYHNTQRNAYFRYQALQKLGNTFSTTSNCFAVWMTMGYFEIEENRFTTGGPIIVDAGHPDGLRLGQEIGADSGEIVRHRAFYIIDRSIPVGHVPGQKLNSENCILLHRMIE